MTKENFIMVAYIAFILLLVTLASTGGLSAIFFLIKGVPLVDKIGHFLLMGILALVVNIKLKYHTITIGKISILLGSAIVFFFVTLEELSQNGNIHRTFDWYDLLADLLGIILIPWLAKRYFSLDNAGNDFYSR